MRLGVSSPCCLRRERQKRHSGAKGLSLISQPSTTGISSSSNPVRARRIRDLACPRSPSRMRLCFDRMALTTCGITESSKPMMPGNNGSPLSSRLIRLARISSFTVRCCRGGVPHWVRFNSPKVFGWLMVSTEEVRNGVWPGVGQMRNSNDRSNYRQSSAKLEP